jgi:4-oxalocrotonate tautomerase
MPHVIVKMWPGPSERAKKQLAEAITKDVLKFADVGEESVSVSIEEVEAGDTLYKQPGYKPF